MTNGGTMASEQSDQLAEWYGVSRDRLSNPNLDLQTIRDMCDALGAAGKEPEGVSYAEVDAGGVPALWCIPAGGDDEAVVLFSHAGGTAVCSKFTEPKAPSHPAKAAGPRPLRPDGQRSPKS